MKNFTCEGKKMILSVNGLKKLIKRGEAKIEDIWNTIDGESYRAVDRGDYHQWVNSRDWDDAN